MTTAVRSSFLTATVPRSWLRHYTTSRKIAGSSPNEVVDFFVTYLILPTALGRKVYSVSNRNEYQKMFLGRRVRPTRKAHNLTAICELIA
jgi:hypothetical protein